MANPLLVELLSLGVKDWNEARLWAHAVGYASDAARSFRTGSGSLTLTADVMERPDLAGEVLANLPLSRADLRSIDAQHTTFRTVSLRLADLTGAQLEGAIFERSDCQGSTFDAAYLGHATFRGGRPDQSLMGASMRGAYIGFADLATVDLRKVALEGALANEYTRFPTGFDPVAAGVIFEPTEPAESPLPPELSEPAVAFTSRRERLDEDERREAVTDFEALLTQVQRLLDDPDSGLDDLAELNLRATAGSLRESLRAPDPDLVVVERLAMRLVEAVAARLDATVLAEAVGVEDPDAQAEFAAAVDDLIDEAVKLGDEDAGSDVEVANATAQRYEAVADSFPAVEVSGVPRLKRVTARLRELRKAGVTGAATAAGGLAAKAAVDHRAILIKLALDGYNAVLGAVEAILRFFS